MENRNYDTEQTSEEIRPEILGECSFTPPESGEKQGASQASPDDAEKAKKAKSVFSISHIALVAFVLISQGIGTVIQVAAMLILPPEQMENPETLGILSMIINIVAMYLTAFPIFLLVAKTVPKASPVPESKIGLGEFATLFVISQGAMLLGAIIGNIFNGIVNLVTGVMPENALDEIVSSIPLWLTFLVVVVVGPIIEEIMFRKVLIDRLSVVGDRAAIIFSAIAFGAFHGNLYQLFYATMVGLILGYVYTKTRRLRYSVALHMLINFAGSIVPMLILKLTEGMSEGGATAVNLVYSIIQYSFILFGGLAAVLYITKWKLQLSRKGDITLPRENRLKPLILNLGVIIFYVICAETMLVSIATEVIAYYLA